MRDTAYRHVAEDTLPNGKWVSTVFLYIGDTYGTGTLTLFETMVFPSKGEWSEVDCERYMTEDEARAGHKAMVAKWLASR